MDWAALGRSAVSRDRRLKMVIRLARHLVAEDAGHELPPDGVFGHHRERRAPFIYSPEDVRLLLDAAWAVPPAGSIVPKTYWTLFALLACTGLRISEALGLRVGDVTSDGLVVRATKFKKNRLVPLHSTAQAGLARYLEERLTIKGGEDHLFVNTLAGPLGYHSVHSVFQRLVRMSGIERGPGNPSPRIHGLRHTFAVRALEASPESRDGVGRHLLALSTYLGHARVADTYWYLEATPELLLDIARVAESFVKGSAS